MKPRVIIYTDGGCDKDGLGGWGAVLIYPARNNHRGELRDAEQDSTSQRMELSAAIGALRALKRPCNVVLHTDSEYVSNAFNHGWIDAWQTNGWRNTSRKPVKNQDLWQALLDAKAAHDVKWKWVRSHSGVVENERCDTLSHLARKELREKLRT